MIFVDTGAWFASVVPWDANHSAAKQWLAHNREPLVTTDYVVDETLTLLRVRGESQRAEQLGAVLFGGSIAALVFLAPADYRGLDDFPEISGQGVEFHPLH